MEVRIRESWLYVYKKLSLLARLSKALLFSTSFIKNRRFRKKAMFRTWARGMIFIYPKNKKIGFFGYFSSFLFSRNCLWRIRRVSNLCAIHIPMTLYMALRSDSSQQWHILHASIIKWINHYCGLKRKVYFTGISWLQVIFFFVYRGILTDFHPVSSSNKKCFKKCWVVSFYKWSHITCYA